MKSITELIRKRRSVFPSDYIQNKDIPREILEEILENANHAPTHKLTEPWHFKILRGGARQHLADFLIEDYIQNTPLEEQNERKLKKMASNPLLSNCIIAICMKRHEGTLPEWEELAAVASAVQNMWLTCTAYGIGCYWSTPAAIERIGSMLPLTEGERCIGLFYMGYSAVNVATIPFKRTPIQDKIMWIE
jgi:nitroreductase